MLPTTQTGPTIKMYSFNGYPSLQLTRQLANDVNHPERSTHSFKVVHEKIFSYPVKIVCPNHDYKIFSNTTITKLRTSQNCVYLRPGVIIPLKLGNLMKSFKATMESISLMILNLMNEIKSCLNEMYFCFTKKKYPNFAETYVPATPRLH